MERWWLDYSPSTVGFASGMMYSPEFKSQGAVSGFKWVRLGCKEPGWKTRSKATLVSDSMFGNEGQFDTHGNVGGLIIGRKQLCIKCGYNALLNAGWVYS